MNILSNQPVIFNESIDTCSTDTDYYTQIVDNTDDTQFQVELNVCNGATEQNPDPNFTDPTEYTLGSGWGISAGVLSRTGAGTSSVSTINFASTTGYYYKIILVVDSITTGGVFTLYLGGSLVGIIQNSGTYEYYTYQYGGGTQLSIVSFVADAEISISTLSVYQILTNVIVAIYDTSDVFIDSISFVGDSNYFTISENSMTVTIDWSELGISNGCYKLCILDPCENTNGQNYPPVITNDTFTGSLTGWTAGASWSYSTNKALCTYNPALPVSRNYLTSSNVFVNYTSTYSVNVKVDAISGTLLVYFGGILVNTITTTGTHLCTGTPNTNLDFYLYCSSGTVTIDSCIPVTISSSDYTCNYTSNDFKLADYSASCPETLLINACNNENGLGFVFNGSGFSPRLRIQGKLKQSKYKSERVMEDDSNGTKRVIYYNRRKEKSLVADLLPEYIHDFLSTLVGYDKFYINGTPYIVEDDEYNVSYDNSQDNVGSISLLVSEQTQLIRNLNCSSEENTCTLGTNYLLQADYSDQYITLVNGELIEINA